MTLDLSAVTDTLLDIVSSSWSAAPLWAELDAAEAAAGSPLSPVPAFTPTFTGFAPDVLPNEPGPQLSLYLYHLESDNAREALFWQPQMLSGAAGPGEPTRFLPTALNLYYLMTAHSAGDYHQEQQLMSVAVRIFHATPIVRGMTVSTPWELTLTMEHRSYDEMSRLWQATTSPLRLSVIYRAAVVFLDPDPAPGPARETTAINVVVENAAGELPPAVSASAGTGSPPSASPPASPPPPHVFGTFRAGSYIGPAGEAVSFTQSPAKVAPGQQVWLVGANLAGAPLSLVAEDGTTTDVSGWVVSAESTASRVVIELPGAGSPPGSSPPAGRYSLQAVGGETALSVAPWLDPAPGSLLTGTSFDLAGRGLAPGEVVVRVGATPVPAGDVSVAADGSSIAFSYLPPALPAGTVLTLSVEVAGVAADPAFWVVL